MAAMASLAKFWVVPPLKSELEHICILHLAFNYDMLLVAETQTERQRNREREKWRG
jgi:hypothetical protein